MNIYKCKDVDGGRGTLIVTENMKRAIEIFQEFHRYKHGDSGKKQLGAEPEYIYNMSIDGRVFIDKLEELKNDK